MLISEMEAVLKSLDQRVGRIEQILPTLATKADLDRFATKADLDRFAMKTDLDRFATKAELRDEIRGVKVLIEDSRSETRMLAEHILGVMSRCDMLVGQMADVLQRLDRIERR